MYLCVMFSIIEHIEYLMTRYDCVVIPQWGAFIANYSAAHYDEDKSCWQRPRRTIGFNANVSHNDGLLAQSLVRREGMSYDEAMAFIADSVTTFRQQLSMDSEVSMGRLGYFKSSGGRYVEFVPFHHDNACDLYYGLADMELRTVETLESQTVAADSDAAFVPKERNFFSRKATQIAASIAVLIGLGVLLSTPVIVDRNHHKASIAPEVTAPQSQQLGSAIVSSEDAQGFQVIDNNAKFAGVGNTEGKYYMVISTLRNQQELEAFKNKYPALVPYMKILDHKGLMCVYVARSDDYSQLMSLRDKLPEKLRDVWIYN